MVHEERAIITLSPQHRTKRVPCQIGSIDLLKKKICSGAYRRSPMIHYLSATFCFRVHGSLLCGPGGPCDTPQRVPPCVPAGIRGVDAPGLHLGREPCSRPGMPACSRAAAVCASSPGVASIPAVALASIGPVSATLPASAACGWQAPECQWHRLAASLQLPAAPPLRAARAFGLALGVVLCVCSPLAPAMHHQSCVSLPGSPCQGPVAPQTRR